MKKALLVAGLLLLVAAPVMYATCYLTFITESLPGHTVGVAASYDIEVCCGTGPYTFAITSGALPAGLSMNSAGHISGTPTAEADTTIFVKLTDSAGCHLTQAFAVYVFAP
jgi:hypothetical protein